MRWARSEVQLDPSDGRFRDQIADIASPVHGVAKDELTGEDVRQHRRAIRLAIGAAIALALLTVAAIGTSIFAVQSASAARAAQHRATAALAKELAAERKTERARRAEHRAKLAAIERRRQADRANKKL